MKKLVIWDFDGVIADTEKLWVLSRMDLLNKYFNLNWNFETTNKNIGGLSDKDKKAVLQKMGINISDDFWNEALKLDMQKLKQGVALTDGIEEIFKINDFEQCIATGGTFAKTELKIKQVGIEKYFPPEKIFTVDLVKYGKPEPDIFLLAADTLGFSPSDCIVVEDSIPGIIAAQKAKMNIVAFVKYSTPQYINEIRKLNIQNIFDNMADVKNFILKMK